MLLNDSQTELQCCIFVNHCLFYCFLLLSVLVLIIACVASLSFLLPVGHFVGLWLPHSHCHCRPVDSQNKVQFGPEWINTHTAFLQSQNMSHVQEVHPLLLILKRFTYSKQNISQTHRFLFSICNCWLLSWSCLLHSSMVAKTTVDFVLLIIIMQIFFNDLCIKIAHHCCQHSALMTSEN